MGAGTINLAAINASCPTAPCTSEWHVHCSTATNGTTAPTFTKLGHNVAVTIGFNWFGAYDIDQAQLVNYTCDATRVLTDLVSQNSTGAYVTFQVRARRAMGRGGAVGVEASGVASACAL